jgi:3'-5' exoribonuclease
MNDPRIPFAVDAAAAAVRGTFPETSSEDLHVTEPPPDAVFERLSGILRVQSLTRDVEGDRIVNRATLYHRRATLCVDWVTQHMDTRLHDGSLVCIKPAARVRCQDGAVRIQRLVPISRPVASCNIFETIPSNWNKDTDRIDRAAALWEELPRPLAHLVTAMLWDGERLHRFVSGPSSLNGHHADIGGNFRHSIDVAEQARAIGLTQPLANVPQLIAGGLLHDLAKAAEYRYDRGRARFYLSERGELIGHRDTLIEWLAVARHSAGVIIDDASWLGFLHMLNAAKGAPDWLGLREPRSLEADILAAADRLSGQGDLRQRTAPQGDSGFGASHPHLGRYRTYVSPAMSRPDYPGRRTPGGMEGGVQ